MTVRDLDPTRSLRSHEDVLVYDAARLAADPQTQPFAPAFDAICERLRTVDSNQRQHHFAVIRAQALASYWGDALDDLTRQLGTEALTIARSDRQSPRYLRYFEHQAPSDVVAMGLETQLNHIKIWPELLQSEPEPSLQAFAPRFSACAAEGRAALSALALAEDARETQRTQEILSLVAAINKLRLDTYSDLAKLGGKRWARSFFG